jgi:hypothetical protein
VKGLAFGLAAGFLLWGCAAPSATRSNPAYKGVSFDGRALQVFTPTDVVIHDLARFETAFRAETKDSIYDPAIILARLFVVSLDWISDASPIHAGDRRPDTARYRDTVMDLAELYYRPDGSVHPDGPPIPVTFRFPSAALLRQAGIEPDLGLQLSHLHTTLDEAQEQAVSTTLAVGMIAGELIPKPKILRLAGTFLVWDYKQDAPVAFGWVETESTFKFILDRAEWKEVVKLAAEDIVRHSPLKGKKFIRRKEYTPSAGGMH